MKNQEKMDELDALIDRNDELEIELEQVQFDILRLEKELDLT